MAPQKRPNPRPQVDGPSDLSDDNDFIETMRDAAVPLRDLTRSAAAWVVRVVTWIGGLFAAVGTDLKDNWRQWQQRRAEASEATSADETGDQDDAGRSWLKPTLLAATLLIAALVVTPIAAVFALPSVARAGGPAGWAVDTFLSVPDLDQDFTLQQRSLVYAADGSSLGMLVGAQNRKLATLDEIPDHVEQAVIATEDANYYEHEGIDRVGIIRAAVTNLRSGEVEQGASTITQQYVKNALLTSERSLSRKLTEAVAAVRLEEKYSKDQILERYLNLAYFGNGAYGVAAAAEYYFGAPLEDVTVGQAAMLAGMVRLPERNNPIDNLDAAIARRNVVLGQMLHAGFIDQDQYEAGTSESWSEDLVTPPPAPKYAFFNEYIKSILLNEEALGEDRSERATALFGGGLRIHTTLDPAMQEAAMAAIAEHVADPAADPLAGLVSLDPETGSVLAMAVGPKTFGNCDGADCTTTKVNPLVPGQGGSGRQAGSAFKPVVAAAALSNGIGTNWKADSEPHEIEGCGAPGKAWEPSNYSDSADRKGIIDMKEATRSSNNVYYSSLIAELGPEKVSEMATKLGISTEVPPYCSIALGTPEVYPIDMARVYGTFANKGISCAPLPISKVENADGEVLVEYDSDCEQVIDEEVAATMNTLLTRVVSSGTGTAAQIGRPVGGKTGTTNDYRDAWFVGYTPQVVTAAWLGFEHPKPMEGVLGLSRVSGGSIPAVLWGAYMSVAMDGMEIEDLAYDDIWARQENPPRPKVTEKSKPEPKPKGKKRRPDSDD